MTTVRTALAGSALVALAFRLDAGLADRLKAADSLMKRHEAAEERSADKTRRITVEFLGPAEDAAR